MTTPRFKDDQLIFGVHFNFETLAGRELFTQPLLTNNNQPSLINFTRFVSVGAKQFDPNVTTSEEAYFLKNEHGYTYHNQYPGVRKDVTEQEGNYRFNLGVEYPWYQSMINKLVKGMQYEYIELETYLNRCIRGLTELTRIVENPEETKERKEKAVAKGKALSILYQRIINEFQGTYPGFTVHTISDEATQLHTVKIIAVKVKE